MKHHRLLTSEGTAIQVPANLDNPPEWLSKMSFAATGETIDIFAYEQGNCNGPKCVDCGVDACHHCFSEWWSLKNCPAEETP